MRPTRNRGAYLLARCQATQDAIAEKLGVSRQAVAKWSSGATRPDDDRRRKLSRLFRIPVAAWEEDVAPQVAEPVAQPGPENDALDGTAEGVLAEADQLERDVRELRRRVRAEPDMTPIEFGRVMSLTGDTLIKIARIRGELNTERVLALPEFQRILRTITEAARGYPDAARAIAEALRALES